MFQIESNWQLSLYIRESEGEEGDLRSTLLAVGLLPRNASYSSITNSMCRGIGSGASPIGYAGFI